MQKNIRQLATIMFTDMVGYTALMQKDENKAISDRARHRKVLEQFIQDHYGLILQYYGDGTLCVFGSAVEAVEAAVKIQQELQKEPQVALRIGMHIGDIAYSDDGVYGDAVNIASRIENLSISGGILISNKVYDEIKNHSEFSTTLLGKFDLKNVNQPLELYALTNKGLQIPEKNENKVEQTKKATRENITTQYSLLETKLYIPQPRPNLVQRPRLLEQLNDRANHKLTLISAPAGFGKTTLVSEWIANSNIQAAWFSLNEADNDQTRFLTYLVAALESISEDIGNSVLDLLHSHKQPPIESILTGFLNELSSIPNEFILVLDDYHVIDSDQVDNILVFLLEHMPLQMHLVITTREDPQLPLPRLRVRGQLKELRAEDLRFTYSEAAGFLKQAMGLDLSEENIQSLEDRTEGWIAGLQLAALSIQGRDDAEQFINTFAGHDRYIVDYLVEEVLQRQPEHIRNFLLQTSCLERLNGPLCNAITDQKNSTKVLENLERANLFVVPLDDKRQWYRYHHLFADVLLAHLMEEKPEQVAVLNSKASIWYEQNGFPSDAIHHAISSEDYERASRLVEPLAEDIFIDGQGATLYGWLKLFPEKLIRSNPKLCIWEAWRALDRLDRETADSFLNDAERLLAEQGSDNQLENNSYNLSSVDKQKYWGVLSSARALNTQGLGATNDAINYAYKALDLLPDNERFWRGGATTILGLAFWTKGNLEEAYKAFADGMKKIQEVGNVHFQIGATSVIADLKIALGSLQDASDKYHHSLKLSAEWNGPVICGTADLYLGLSDLYFEFNDLEASERYFLQGKELGKKAALLENLYRWCLSESRMLAAQGDLNGALIKIEEAERLFIPDAVPATRPVKALKVKMWLALGKLDEALNWVEELGLPSQNELQYLREYEHITMARVLISLHKSGRKNYFLKDAIQLIDRLLDEAEKGKRTGSVIEILIVKALSHQAEGNNNAALKSLEKVLMLTEPEGYIRIFVDEGMAMQELLSEAAEKEINPTYVKKLLSAFETKPITHVENLTPVSVDADNDALSPRELEVLQLIAQGFSNQEISDRLFLALSTVKGHNLKIFAKLQVTRRTEAVARARELGLV